jgi:hypothetical protein
MAQFKMLPPAEYKWLFKCNKKSTISFKDIAEIYNVSPHIMETRIQSGYFPHADYYNKRMNGYIPCRAWNVLTVIEQVLIDVKKGQIDQYAEQIGV